MASKTVRNRLAAGTALLIVLLCSVPFALHKHNSLSQMKAVTADWVEANGVATREDYIRTVHLQDSAGEGNRLNEQDVDWLLAFANNPRFQGRSRTLRQMYAGGVLSFATLKQLPQSRRGEVYNFGASLLQSSGQDDVSTGNTRIGCLILGHLRDKRAVVLIEPLLSSQDKGTRMLAEEALDSLGVEIPPHA